MALPPLWWRLRGLFGDRRGAFFYLSGLGAAVTFLAMLSGPRGARFTSQLSVSGLVLPPDTIIIYDLIQNVKSLI